MPRKKKMEKVEREKEVEEAKPKTGTYELIITEKPQAALKIAYALADTTPAKKVLNGVPYYELKCKGKNVIVACSVGHLFSLASLEKGWPIFNVEWLASYKLKNDFTRKYYSVIASLVRNAGSFMIATDYDVEGELIGYNILRYILKQEDARRMKFSTLTKEDILNAYDNSLPSIEWGFALSGETRHILDWFYGINFSRALMNALSKAGRFRIMSVGRVQGPALAFVVSKEKQIRNFKPHAYWQVYIVVADADNKKVELKYEKDIIKQVELAKFHKLKGKNAVAKTEKSMQRIMPGFPFDLTTLQLEAYRLHGFSPSRVLRTSQELYLTGLISYPRTASQKLPPSISYKNIIKKLSKHTELVRYISRDKPLEGKKQDAHPAIFPTGEVGKLTEEQKKIYDLIVKRFIACFCQDALIENKKITVVIDSLKFIANGLSIKEKGWMNVYKARLQERELPDINGNVEIKEIRIEEKQTQPPHRYSQASLVAELARKNLGTKATRALIIDTLYERGYIKNEPIEATPFGMVLIDTLEKEAPVIVDENLTRHFESELQKIEKAKEKKKLQEKILDESKKVIINISERLKQKQEQIGKELIKGYEDLEKSVAEQARIMKCPECKEGWLVVRKNRQGRQFLACNKYPECKKTFSLPPYGLIKKSDETCKCGFPILMAINKGRKPWKFCFNPACPSKSQQKSSQ